MFNYIDDGKNTSAEEAIKEYLAHIKKVKAGKEKENPRYLKKAEEELTKAMPSRKYRRLALKALKSHPDEVLEFLKSSDLKL